MNGIKKMLLPCFVVAIFAFIYLPIIVLIVFSCNKIAFPYRWAGFSLAWYQELFESTEIWYAVKNSLIVALSAVFLSLTMGVTFIFYTAKSNYEKLIPFFYGNLIFPEIILAVSLLALFTFFAIPTGLLALIAAHTVLGFGYVVPILATRFKEIDYSVIEASLDLGASLNQTFVRIVIPLLFPALIAAGLLVFVISFDDFLLAFFCAGTSAQTLPLYIFALIRTGISPVINALSTLLLVVSSIGVLIFCSLKSKIRIF